MNEPSCAMCGGLDPVWAKAEIMQLSSELRLLKTPTGPTAALYWQEERIKELETEVERLTAFRKAYEDICEKYQSAIARMSST